MLRLRHLYSYYIRNISNLVWQFLQSLTLKFVYLGFSAEVLAAARKDSPDTQVVRQLFPKGCIIYHIASLEIKSWID
jgi:hypothetical protein